MKKLLLYSVEGCPFCDTAKNFMHEKGLPFDEIAAPPGSPAWREMKERSGSGLLPQIFIDGKFIGGHADLTGLEATGTLYRELGMEPSAPDSVLYDVIILGGGPAGLSAAIYAVRKVLKTLIISKDIGGQVTWTQDVDNYLGFIEADARALVGKFDEHVGKFGVERVIGVDVASVDLTGRIKRVHTNDGKTYLGRTLIIATGGRHRPLDVPGETEFMGRGLTYCSICDAPLYADADVAVVGGGNSAMEAVIDLIPIARRIHIISLGPLTGDPVYRGKIDRSDKVEILGGHVVTRITGKNGVQGVEIKNVATGELMELPVEGVFVEIGILPSTGIFVDILATNGKGEILVDNECRTGVAGVFACGDVTSVPFKQVVVAVGEGAKAALSAYNYLIRQK